MFTGIIGPKAQILRVHKSSDKDQQGRLERERVTSFREKNHISNRSGERIGFIIQDLKK